MTYKPNPSKSYVREDKDKYNIRDRIEHIKSTIDIHYLLEGLGFVIERESPKEVRSICPIHGGDNRTAFRFNKETSTWVCFTQRCHETHGNDIIGLVKAITKKDFGATLEYLSKFVPDMADTSYIKSKREREIGSFMKSYENRNLKHKDVNEEVLNARKPFRSNYFLKQGFKRSTLDFFEIAGGWKDSENVIRDIIPIRDELSNLLAYSLRDTRENVEDTTFKYILTPGFDKQNCLYNLNNAKKYSDRLPIIVVEGFKSVWRLYELGINNVVACMGASLTDGQQLLLCSYAMKGIVIMLDNDVPGALGIEKACESLSGKLDVFPVYIQEVDEDGKGLDPADLPEELIYDYLKGYH